MYHRPLLRPLHAGGKGNHQGEGPAERARRQEVGRRLCRPGRP